MNNLGFLVLIFKVSLGSCLRYFFTNMSDVDIHDDVESYFKT